MRYHGCKGLLATVEQCIMGYRLVSCFWVHLQQSQSKLSDDSFSSIAIVSDPVGLQSGAVIVGVIDASLCCLSQRMVEDRVSNPHGEHAEDVWVLSKAVLMSLWERSNNPSYISTINWDNHQSTFTDSMHIQHTASLFTAIQYSINYRVVLYSTAGLC